MTMEIQHIMELVIFYRSKIYALSSSHLWIHCSNWKRIAGYKSPFGKVVHRYKIESFAGFGGATGTVIVWAN